jgi:WhiB family redox-sensing transcriptional regulator
VRATCLDWAVKHREAGIWGGLNDRERARLPVQVRICVECAAEFVHMVKGGGRHPATCSKPCRRARRQRQQWASYERAGRANVPGLYAQRGHGTLARYAAGCKCQSCRKVARVARADARRTARAHVRWLSEQGVGLKQIVKVSAISQGCIWKLMYGDRKRFGRPSKRIRRETEQAILAVLPDRGADGSRIPAGPTWGHIETLLGRGWSKAAIGRHVHGPGAVALQLGRRYVTRVNARVIEGLLDLPVEPRLSRSGTPVSTAPAWDPDVERDDMLRAEARRAARRDALTVYGPDVEDPGPTLLTEPVAWKRRASCRRPEFPTYLFFPAPTDTVTTAAAKAVCARCPVHGECLDFAVATGAEGIWGGTTDDERGALVEAIA